MPPIRPPAERVGRTLSQLAAGTRGGRLDSAARPVTPVGELRVPAGGGGASQVGWSFGGPILVSISPRFPVPADGTITRLLADLTVTPTVDGELRWAHNGVYFGPAVALTAGGNHWEATTSEPVTVGDYLQAVITVPGTGGVDLVTVAVYG